MNKSEATWPFVKRLRNSAISFLTKFAKMDICYKKKKPEYIIKTWTIEHRSNVFWPIVFLNARL